MKRRPTLRLRTRSLTENPSNRMPRTTAKMAIIMTSNRMKKQKKIYAKMNASIQMQQKTMTKKIETRLPSSKMRLS